MGVEWKRINDSAYRIIKIYGDEFNTLHAIIKNSLGEIIDATYSHWDEFGHANQDRPEYQYFLEDLRCAINAEREGPFCSNGSFSQQIAEKRHFMELEPVRIYHERIGGHITKNQPMAYINERDELLYYSNGTYIKGGEHFVDRAVEGLLGPRTTNHVVKEIVGHIKRSNSTPSSNLLDGKNEICLLNGIFDLETKKLRKHDSDSLFCTQVPITYDAEAECPKIDEFFSQIVEPSDKDLLYEIMGYCLQPGYPFQKAFLFIGNGDNGKTTYLNLLRRFIGERNCSHVSLQSLDYDRFAIADLYQKMANICADISANDLTQVNRFKELTGNDWIRAEFKNQQAFNFQNHAKLVFSANMLPRTADDTDAFFKRWIIPIFPNSFPTGSPKRDEDKLEKITVERELSGLFNRVVAAYEGVVARRYFTGSSTVEETRARWLQLSDSLYCFLQERCHIDTGEVLEEEDVRTPIRHAPKTIKQDFLDAYLQYCKEKKIPPIRERELKNRLFKLTNGVVIGGQVSNKNGIKVWRNIELLESEEQERGEQLSIL